MQASKRIEKLKQKEEALREELSQLTDTLKRENADLTADVLDHLDMNDINPQALAGGILHLKKISHSHDSTQFHDFACEGASLLRQMKKGK